MKTQIPGIGLKDLIRMTSLPGWILLARPIIYFLFSRRRDLDAYSVVDFSAMVFIIYSFIAFVVGLVAIRKTLLGFGREVLVRSPIVIFIVYSIYGIISMAWSVSPTLTGFRAFECIAMTLLIVAVIQDLFETGDLEYVILWSLMYCTEDILCALFRTAQWATSLSELLQSSQMMSTTFFFMALYFVPRRWYNYLVIVLAVFSMSTVAYIGMAVGLISSFWEKGRTKVIAVVGAILVVLAVFVVGPNTFLKNTIFFDKAEVSMTESSGRDKLMKVTIESLGLHPMGLGFFAAEPYILYAKNLGAISAHNSLFSAAMGLGIPGVILMIVFLFALGFISFSHHIPALYRPIVIGCFIVALLQCLGNPSVGTRVFGAWLPCMYIFVLNSAMYKYGKYYEPKGEIENEDNVGYEKLS